MRLRCGTELECVVLICSEALGMCLQAIELRVLFKIRVVKMELTTSESSFLFLPLLLKTPICIFHCCSLRCISGISPCREQRLGANCTVGGSSVLLPSLAYACGLLPNPVWCWTGVLIYDVAYAFSALFLEWAERSCLFLSIRYLAQSTSKWMLPWEGKVAVNLSSNLVILPKAHHGLSKLEWRRDGIVMSTSGEYKM